jgi:protein tyrosine/serine phosphatase
LCLSPKLLEGEGAALVAFCAADCVALHRLDVGENREPFMEMRSSEVGLAVAVAADKANYPLLVVCVSGKNRTGVVVGCLRKVHHRWSLTAVIDELSRFLGPSKTNLLDLQFIECF